MARIDQGNALTSDILQPGWTSTSDGFGLIVINATFKSDSTTGAFAPFVRGTAFPVSSYSYCKAHKGSISWDALGIATLKVDYVGIDPTVNSGARTNANTSVANGLTAENLTSHPNFFTSAGWGGVLAGMPTDFTDAYYPESELGPDVMRDGKAVKSRKGYNGACFEKPLGGRFIGFVDPDYPSYYGKTQYLAATTTMSGVMYVASPTDVQALYALLGSATATDSWGIYQLIPSWAPVGTVTDIGNKNLLSQINVEEYGTLYKVSYEIRYSTAGWDDYVYKNI